MPEDQQGSDDEPFADVAGQALSGALVGMAFAGPAGAAAGALTPLAARIASLSAAELRGRQERAVRAWQVAADEADAPVGQLFERALEDIDRQHLGHSVGEAAALSRYPARIVALGRALAAGLLTEDDAALDHEQQMVDALSTIERPHLVLLRRLLVSEPLGDGVSWVPLVLDWDELNQAVPTLKKSLPRLLATVQREGLVRTDTVATYADDSKRPTETHTGVYWQLTPFGKEALARLNNAGLADLALTPEPSDGSSSD